jgi:hypothetical protein
VRTGTHVVGDHETPTPKASIGTCAMWTHEEYHMPASGNTRQEWSEPNDITEGDEDPPKTHHVPLRLRATTVL